MGIREAGIEKDVVSSLGYKKPCNYQRSPLLIREINGSGLVQYFF